MYRSGPTTSRGRGEKSNKKKKREKEGLCGGGSGVPDQWDPWEHSTLVDGAYRCRRQQAMTWPRWRRPAGRALSRVYSSPPPTLVHILRYYYHYYYYYEYKPFMTKSATDRVCTRDVHDSDGRTGRTDEPSVTSVRYANAHT